MPDNDFLQDVPAAQPTDAAADASSYVDDAKAAGQEQNAPLATSLYAASKMDPERHAKVVALADKSGLAPELVDRNFEYLNGVQKYDDQTQAADFATIFAKRPTLAKWLQDRDNAALAQDDLPVLKQIHDRLEALNPAPIADDREELPWLSGVVGPNVRRAVGHAGQALMAIPALVQLGGRSVMGIEGEPSTSTPLGAIYSAEDLMRSEEEAAKSYQTTVTKQVAGAVVGMAAQPQNVLLPIAGGMAAARGLQQIGEVVKAATALRGAAAVQGVQAGAAALGETMRERQAAGGGAGLPSAGETANAAAQGALAYVTGKAGGLIGPLRALRDVQPNLAEVGGDIVRNTALGGALGAGGQAMQALLTGKPMPTAGDIAMAWLTSAVPGGVLAAGNLPSAYAHNAAARLADQTLAAHAAQQGARDLAGTAVALQNSLTQERSAARTSELMKAIVDASGQQDTGKLYHQGEAWNDYWTKQGVDPAEVAAAVTGDPDAYAHAMATGGPIVSPQNRFLSQFHGTDHFAALLSKAALGPDKPTLEEANDFFKNGGAALEKLHEQIRTEIASGAGAIDQAGETIREDVKAKLIESGMDPDAAEQNARLHQAFWSTIAGRFNEHLPEGSAKINPLDLFNAVNLHIQRVLPDLVTRPELHEKLEPLLNQLRAAKEGDGREASGDALPPHLRQLAAALQRAGVKLSEHPTNEGVFEAIRKGLIQETARATKDGSKTPVTLEQPGHKGSITFGSVGTTIKLFQEADLSTFVHESGHLFLETFGELASRADAPEEFKADWAKTLEWMGVKDRAAITAEQHEQFARGFERYLMEGVAPAPALRSAFARIKAWMVHLYDTVKGLKVDLSPDMRAVFDRLLASRDEIAAAAQRDGADPLFMNAAQAGMTDAGFKDYQRRALAERQDAQDRLERKLMATFTREQSRQYQADRERIEADVSVEMNDRQDLSAVAALQKGRKPSGSELPKAMENVKLDKRELIRIYGEDNLEHLPGAGGKRANQNNRGAHVYALDGGIPLEDAAQLFGYRSGDELWHALINAPDLKKTITDVTNARMRELYPDAMLDGTMAAKAIEALNNDQRAERLDGEAAALATQMNRSATPRQLLKVAARDAIARLVPGSLRPKVYERAQAKAARAAFTALSKGDRERALIEKQREQLNLELHRAALDAAAEYQDMLKKFASFGKPAVRQKIGKAGGWEWTVVRPDGLSRKFPSEQEAREAVAKFPGSVFEQTSGYLERIDTILKEMGWNAPPDGVPNHWRSLDLDQLRAVHDALAETEHNALFKNKMMRKEAQRTFRETADRGAASIIESAPKARLPKILPEAWEVKTNALFSVPHLIYRMDGHRDGGTMFDTWQRPINEATDHASVLDSQDVQLVHGKLDEWGKLSGGNPTTWLNNVNLLRREYIPEIKDSLSKWQQLMVAANWGNAGNRERLMDGHKWSEEQVAAIIDRLDAKDKALVEHMWRQVSSKRSEIAALEQRVHGVAPQWVEATPFRSKLGEWEGGYFPIAYDNAKSINPHGVGSEIDEGKSLLEGRGGAYAMTAHGHTEARAGSQGRPLLLDFSVFTNHLTKVNKDLALRETLMDANRLLRDKAWSDAVVGTYGKGAWDQFQNQLLAIAGGDKGLPVGFEKPLSYVRQGSNAAMRAFNISGSLQQLAGLPFIIPRVGVRNFLRGLVPAFSPEGHRWLSEQEPAMRFRNAERGKMLNEAIDRGSIIGPLRAFPNTAYMFMNKAWSVLDTHAWYAAYYHALEQFPHDDAKARAVATNTVSMTQGATHIKDQAQAMRGGELAKVFTNNMSWANANFNLMVESVQRFVDKGYTGEAGWKMASDLLTYLVVCPAVYLAVRQAISREDMSDWTDPKKTAKHLAGEAVYTVASTMPLLRDAAAPLQEGKRSDGLQGASGLTNLINAAGSVSHAIQSEKEGRYQPGISPGTKAALRVGGILFHFPSSQIVRMLDGYLDAERTGANPIWPTLMGPPPKP